MDIKRNPELLALVFDCLNAGIWSIDLSSGEVWWSDQMFLILGYKPDAFKLTVNTFLDVIVHPEDKITHQKAVEKFQHDKSTYQVQIRLKTFTGEYRYFECSGKGILKEGRFIFVAGTVVDVHDKTLLQKEFIKSQKSLKQASKLSKTGAWELELPTFKPRWSEEACELFEIECDAISNLKSTLKHYNATSRSAIVIAIRKAIQDGSSWDLELPITTGKKNQRWIRNIGYVVEEKGKAIKLYGAFQDITDRKIAEEKLNVIFESSTDAHILYDDNGIIDCNHATLGMFGCLDKAEVIGKHPSSFSPSDQPEGNLLAFRAAMDSLALNKQVGKFEWLHQRLNGEVFPTQVAVSPVILNNKKAFLGVWHDLTESYAAQETIRINQIMLADTQELTHSGSWEINLKTDVNIWSEEAFRIFGLEPGRIGPTTKEFNSMIHPEDWPIYEQKVIQAMKGEEPEGADLRIILKDGSIKYIHAIGKGIMGKDGRAMKIAGAVLDINDRKIAEKELIQAKYMAEQAALAKTQFLSTMSHEIRTPMNAVIGFTDLLFGLDPTEAQLEYLNILKFSAGHLLVLINDILDFNKIEAGKIEFEEVPFNLRELIGNIKAASNQKASEKGIQLKMMLDSDIPETVIGDPVRLGQILTNLTSNAVKFTHQGKVNVQASLEAQQHNMVVIHFAVSDTGIGIEPDKLETIFESFTQASADTTRKYGGTGLGLTITKRLLEMQNSSIHVLSRPGEGAVFSFSLSFKVASIKKITPGKIIQNKVRNLQGIRVLIAEDNQINIMLIRQYMKLWDIEYDVANNGLEAFDLVQKKNYDVVLMDLQMPEMDGYEATEKIRKLKAQKYSRLPIIALTASAMMDVKDFAFTVGMNDYISKPFNPEELYDKLAHHSGKSKQKKVSSSAA